MCLKCKGLYQGAEYCPVCKRPMERVESTGKAKLKAKLKPKLFKDPVPLTKNSDMLFMDEVDEPVCPFCANELNSHGYCNRCRQ